VFSRPEGHYEGLGAKNQALRTIIVKFGGPHGAIGLPCFATGLNP